MACPKDDLNKIHVVFCGSTKYDINKKNWLYGMIEKTLGWERVTHIEYTESKEIYDILDISVLPSSLEGFPLVVIESMMSRVCTVRSKTEGASEQIIDGETGRLFEPGNVNQFSGMLHELIADEKERNRLALNGREYAMNQFSAKRMAENSVGVYEKVINDY